MSGVMVPYRSNRPLRGTRYLAGGRLGALGTSDAVNLIASKGITLAAGTGASLAIGTAAGTIGAAAFGAAAGSVVPVIGTVIGAVVGLLTSKLFGHANYAQVYADIANVRALWQAYPSVAGQYVGRQYGWPELQQLLHGAMVSGLFTGNGPAPGVVCTQAMISKNIHACGTGEWVDDLIGVGPASGDQSPSSPHAGSGTNNMLNLIGNGLAQGIVDPVTMTDKVLVPGMEAIANTKGNSWASVSRSQNPALYRQYLMDLADYIMSLKNPNMPAYYGTQNIQPLPSAAAPATAPQQAIQPVVASNNPTPASSANVQSVTPLGVTITPAQGGTLVTAQGSWQFGGSNTAAGFPVYFNGQQVGGMFGVQMSVAGIPNMIRVIDAYGNAYVWSGNGWTQTVTAPSVAATPAPPPPAPITTAAGNVVPPASIPINPTPPALAAAGGSVAPVDATAAYLAQLQQQGASQNQAMLAAIQQLQSQGMSAQAAQSTVAAAAPYASIPPATAAAVTPDATPVAQTAGLSSVPGGAWAIIGGAVLLSFALARPKNRNIGKRRR